MPANVFCLAQRFCLVQIELLHGELIGENRHTLERVVIVAAIHTLRRWLERWLDTA
jgi:hypothetical protein